MVDRGVDDALDEGYSPVEKPLPINRVEDLDDRLAEEVPDISRDNPVADENRMWSEEVGDARSGRLTAADDGDIYEDNESDLVGRDVGIDGGAASAEEAAVHEVDED